MPAFNCVLESAMFVDDLETAACSFYRDIVGFTAITRDDRVGSFDVAGRSILLLFTHGGTNDVAGADGDNFFRIMSDGMNGSWPSKWIKQTWRQGRDISRTQTYEYSAGLNGSREVVAFNSVSRIIPSPGRPSNRTWRIARNLAGAMRVS